jgi:hypothetical protein
MNQPPGVNFFPVVDFKNCFKFYIDRPYKDTGIYNELFTNNMDNDHLPVKQKIDSDHIYYDVYRTHDLLTPLGIKKINPPVGLCCSYVSSYLEQNFTKKHYNQLTYHRGSHKECKQFIDHYFTPSEQVNCIQDELICKYNITPHNTLAMCHRGTDKYTEVRPTDYHEYLTTVLEMIKHDSTISQIIIQSDQTQFVEYMNEQLQHLGVTAIIIEENMTTDTKQAVHWSFEEGQKLHRIQTFLATVQIISQCKYVVTSTSNVGAWINLYRGYPHGLIQMNNGSQANGGGSLPALDSNDIAKYNYTINI